MSEFRVPLHKFVEKHLATGPQEDRIWAGPLKAFHGNKHFTPTEWKQIIENLRNQPAHRPN